MVTFLVSLTGSVAPGRTVMARWMWVSEAAARVETEAAPVYTVRHVVTPLLMRRLELKLLERSLPPVVTCVTAPEPPTPRALAMLQMDEAPFWTVGLMMAISLPEPEPSDADCRYTVSAELSVNVGVVCARPSRWSAKGVSRAMAKRANSRRFMGTLQCFTRLFP